MTRVHKIKNSTERNKGQWGLCKRSNEREKEGCENLRKNEKPAESWGKEESEERGRRTGRVLNTASDINFPLTVGH